jgi:hypothetical protein
MSEPEIDTHAVIMLQAEAMKRGGMVMWTVYAKPRDYPTGYVARMFEIIGGRSGPTHRAMYSLDLEPIQEKLERAGLARLERDETDEPHIIEVWI